MSFAPGVRLGPYEIVGALGAGGMGEVYRADLICPRPSMAVAVCLPFRHALLDLVSSNFLR
jgi:hypothetical protein